MLRANQAVRLGLRAATRNPELSFGKALLDQGGNLLAFLPVGLALAGVWALSADEPLRAVLRIAAFAGRVQLPLLGATVAAGLIAWALGAAFWSGALPLLAADAELGRRPPSGNFFLLVGRGFGRVLPASFAVGGIALLAGAATTAAMIFGIPALLLRPELPGFVALAALLAVSIAFGLAFDLLSRLVLVRAAALGDTATAAFGRAASLFGARLGTLAVVTAAFFVLDIVAATAAAAVGGALSGELLLDPQGELLALAPRVAVGLAFAAVFAWIEVARNAALAAVAADAEGLLEEEQPAPMAEPVLEALRVPEEEQT